MDPWIKTDAYTIADAPRSSRRVGSCDDPVDYELTDITQAHMASNERPSTIESLVEETNQHVYVSRYVGRPIEKYKMEPESVIEHWDQ